MSDLVEAMEKWDDLKWRSWYAEQIALINQRAKIHNPEVQQTLKWSLPWLRKVVAGKEKPVYPPALKKNTDRLKDLIPEVNAVVMSPTGSSWKRPNLALRAKKKAPVIGAL